MTLRSSFKDASILSKAAAVLAIIFLISVGLCGIAGVVPSHGFQNRDLAFSLAGAIGLIASAIGLAIVGIIALINHFRRSMSDKDPPP